MLSDNLINQDTPKLLDVTNDSFVQPQFGNGAQQNEEEKAPDNNLQTLVPITEVENTQSEA